MRQSHLQPLLWLQHGVELYLSYWLTIFGFFLLYSIVSIATIGILAGPLLVGFYRILDRLQMGDGYRPEIRDLFGGFDRFGDAVAQLLIWSFGPVILLTFLAVVPLIGPVIGLLIIIVLGPLAQFGFPLIALEGKTWTEASVAILAGVRYEPLMFPLTGWAFSLLPALLAVFGVRFGWVGFLITLLVTPVTLCSVAMSAPVVNPWLANLDLRR
ncbi:MAG: hypothetical protein ACLFP4_05330 [Spirochaetales bacterium]